jgi:hypothetical protein
MMEQYIKLGVGMSKALKFLLATFFVALFGITLLGTSSANTGQTGLNHTVRQPTLSTFIM